MKKGFTLAEVLITLAIIGVVAALTIPSVIVKTQQQEFKTAAKKAYSVLSQAVQLTEVKDGYTFANGGLFVQALINNMNVVKVEKDFSMPEDLTLNTAPMLPYPGSALAQRAPTGGTGVIDPEEIPSITNISIAVFYTADGMRYHIVELEPEMMVLLVDVNGDKGPTRYDTDMEQFGNSQATCTGPKCDSSNPEWPDINLTDIFIIMFQANGPSQIVPAGVPGGNA